MIKYLDQSLQVLYIQVLLKENGYDLPLTGTYDDNTIYALEDFLTDYLKEVGRASGWLRGLFLFNRSAGDVLPQNADKAQISEELESYLYNSAIIPSSPATDIEYLATLLQKLYPYRQDINAKHGYNTSLKQAVQNYKLLRGLSSEANYRNVLPYVDNITESLMKKDIASNNLILTYNYIWE